MPFDIDRYPSLGRKRRISGPEEALRLVRETHPDATQHGSVGAERSWTVDGPDGRMIVAHHWNPWRGRSRDVWWLRVAASVEEGIRDL